MTPKRKNVQDFIIKYIGKIVSGKENVTLYENMFNSMTDAEFDTFMKRMRDGEIHLSVVVPNDGKQRVTVENNFKVGKELGHNFFQRVKVTNHPDYPDHMLPLEFLTIMLPARRAQQLLSKKISIPKHNNSIDTITGQVAGDSRAGSLTYPEQQIMLSMGMKETALELAKIRGGDQGAAKALNDKLYRDGKASQEEVNAFSTTVGSTKALNNYLLGMHISSTLLK